MGFSREFDVDCIVYIDPVRYYRLPYKRKYDVKKVLSDVNWQFRGKGKRLILLTPGRICTSSPELGVPSGFSDGGIGVQYRLHSGTQLWQPHFSGSC